MVEFDSDMVIHVHEGGRAVFEKNWYSNTNQMFNVFEGGLRVKMLRWW
ncbi:hypothetical protein [Persicobacter diffluens]|uniref:Uncharacterized protein n=1 Tax=Persicobacter diffluens TaxID=981 RepID=A0AAN4W6G8_9BACT|nr:hypothetical protein PEDI_55070 [Persicobacter diffluens]